MKAISYIALALLFELFAILPLAAQEKAKLFGSIWDHNSSAPIEKACVYLEPTRMGAETTVDGSYYIPELPPGKYKLTVMMMGYETITGKIIQLQPGEAKELNFFLKPTVLNYPEKIVVTATRGNSLTSEVAASVDVIEQDLIELTNPQNMGEVLKNVQGVFIKDYGGVGGNKTISLRGSSAEQVLVLLDGQRLNDAQSGQVDFSGLSVEGVERIEVVRGGSSALYGADAVGGVINIITRKSSEKNGFSGSASYLLGSWDSQSLETLINFQEEKMGGAVSYKKLTSQGDFSYTDVDGTEKNKVNNDVASNDFFSRFYLSLGDPHYQKRLELSYKYYEAERGSPGTIELPYNTARLWNRNEQLNGIFSGKVFNFRNDFRLQAYAHRVKSRYKNDEGLVLIDSHYKNASCGGEGQLQTILTSDFVLTYGGGYRHDGLDSPEFPEDHFRNSFYLFLQDESLFELNNTRLLKSISLIAALRFDNFSDFKNHLSPKFGGVFNFGQDWKTSLKWNVGLSYRAPNFNELYWPPDAWTQGNPDLKAEHGFDWDLGLRLRYPVLHGIALDFTYFNITMSDLILWQSVGQIWMPLNVDKARNQGVETSLALEPIKRWLSLNVNYTFLDARNLSDESNVHNKLLVYRPKHSLNFSAACNWKMFTLKYDYQYIGQRYTNPANTVFLEGYRTSDVVISANYQFRQWKPQLSFQVKNIFDEQYEIIRYQPIPGREFRFTVGIFLN
jgi:outer membrane cobalamin receptor